MQAGMPDADCSCASLTQGQDEKAMTALQDSNGKSARDIATSQESQDLLDQPKLAYTF